MTRQETIREWRESTAEERRARLDRAYSLILSWPNAKTAERGKVDGQTHSAASPIEGPTTSRSVHR